MNTPAGPFVKLNIVYEDEDLAVIDKPAGLLVHSAPKIQEKTLADFLVERYPEIKNVGDPVKPPVGGNGAGDPLRPGIVHRLDRETSGLMVVAKNQATFEFLKNQFQERKVEKRYLALVWGLVVKDEGQIILPIGRSRKFGRQAAGFKAKNIRPALTEFKVRERFADFTLLDVYPKTGRMHQIRAHLAAIGHPVAGDRLYAKKKSGEAGLGRQFLHAYFLKFTAPGGKILQFRSELPEDLKRYLATIESLK
jgi:23S rRNA pseudouridine1911/1915/1917 synthase